MAITLELPPGMEDLIRAEAPDLDLHREAMIGLAVELFRREAISLHEFGQILGMDRFQADRFLAKRGEYAQTLSVEEVMEDVRKLDRLLGQIER